MARSATLAEGLKSRADSLEVGQSKYDGLLVRLDEVLERQGSFALNEGNAVFLSRFDATRFRDLNDQLLVLTDRRKAWADGVFRRRPSWMLTLPDSRRPHFEGSPLKGS